VWRDNRRETIMKGNNGSGWSSDGMVLWLGSKQNGDAIEWLGECPRLRWFFIPVKGENQAIQGGWPAVIVQIQCFGFGLRGKAAGWSIAEIWSGGSELILVQWEGSVTWCGGVMMSIGGEAAPGRGKGGDGASWVDVNLIELKNKENQHDWFSCFRWVVEI
jgi:hypothetical protein